MSLSPGAIAPKRDSYLCQLVSRTTCLAEGTETAVEALISKLSGVMRTELKAEKEKDVPDETYPPQLDTLRSAIVRIERSIRAIRIATEATEV